MNYLFYTLLLTYTLYKNIIQNYYIISMHVMRNVTHRELCITKGEPLGMARVGEHNIRTIDISWYTIPVAQPYRRIIPTEVESVKSLIDDWYR